MTEAGAAWCPLDPVWPHHPPRTPGRCAATEAWLYPAAPGKQHPLRSRLPSALLPPSLSPAASPQGLLCTGMAEERCGKQSLPEEGLSNLRMESGEWRQQKETRGGLGRAQTCLGLSCQSVAKSLNPSVPWCLCL